MNKQPHFPVSSAQHRYVLARFDAGFRDLPPSMAGLRKASASAHSLSATVKHLLALAMAVEADDEHRIRCHVQGARLAGATRREITDTVTVAVLVGGEALALAGQQALKALEQFEAMPFYLEWGRRA